jgi:Flp pilus assembly protein TadG
MRHPFAAGNRGTALVEFALVTPLLLLILAGILDYGQALSKATTVANAARIGAQYAISSQARSTDTTGIRAAVINSSPGFSGLSVASARTCRCPGGSSVRCRGACGGGIVQMYVKVTVTSTSSAMFSYSGLPFTGSVKGQATMRAQ